MSSEIKFHKNMTILYNEHQYNFFIISRSVLLRMKDISDRICRGNRNTRFTLNNFFFFFFFFFLGGGNCTIYEILWKNIVQLGRPQMTIWHMRIACWMPEATNTYRGCVILISFPLQQCWNEGASL